MIQSPNSGKPARQLCMPKPQPSSLQNAPKRMSLASAVRTAVPPTSRCAVGRDFFRLARRRAAAAPRRVSLALGPRKPASGVTRRASQDPGASVDVDDVTETSAAARDEALECVVVGMEAACVLSEDEGDVDEGASRSDAPSSAKNALADDPPSGLLWSALGGAALVSPFFLWGTSMVAMKEVLPATSPLFVASVRLVPAGLVLIAWAASQKRPWPKGKDAWLAVSQRWQRVAVDAQRCQRDYPRALKARNGAGKAAAPRK